METATVNDDSRRNFVKEVGIRLGRRYRTSKGHVVEVMNVVEVDGSNGKIVVKNTHLGITTVSREVFESWKVSLIDE